MASEKQIAANRRNARKSTGPRSSPGKKRSSSNAYRHGLSRPVLGADFSPTVELLARRLAGSASDPMTLASARDAAEAMLDLARVRRAKVALIDRAHRFGRLETAKIFKSPLDEAAWIMQHFWGVTLWKTRPKFATDPLPPMPTQEPARTIEAVRRVLPELQRLARYEARAVARRDRAILTLAFEGIDDAEDFITIRMKTIVAKFSLQPETDQQTNRDADRQSGYI